MNQSDGDPQASIRNQKDPQKGAGFLNSARIDEQQDNGEPYNELEIRDGGPESQQDNKEYGTRYIVLPPSRLSMYAGISATRLLSKLRGQVHGRMYFLIVNNREWELPVCTPTGRKRKDIYPRNKNGKIDGSVIRKTLLQYMSECAILAKENPSIGVTAQERIDAYTKAEDVLLDIIELRKTITNSRWAERTKLIWWNYFTELPFVQKDTRGILAEFNDRMIKIPVESMKEFLISLDEGTPGHGTEKAIKIWASLAAVKKYVDGGRPNDPAGRYSESSAKTLFDIQTDLVESLKDGMAYLTVETVKTARDLPHEIAGISDWSERCAIWFNRRNYGDYTLSGARQKPSGGDDPSARQIESMLRIILEKIKAPTEFLDSNKEGWDLPLNTPSGLYRGRPYYRNKNDKVDGKCLKKNLFSSMRRGVSLGKNHRNLSATDPKRIKADTCVVRNFAAVKKCKKIHSPSDFEEWDKGMRGIEREYFDIIIFVHKDTRGTQEDFEEGMNNMPLDSDDRIMVNKTSKKRRHDGYSPELRPLKSRRSSQ